MDFINKNLRGILFCFALAVPATYLGKLFPVVGAPVFAILFGLAAAFWKRPAFFQPGIQFTAKKILQYSIILLGFGMNLFEILAENLKEANKTYMVTIPWYIMTSRENNKMTRDFLEKNNYFGYDKNAVT